MEKRLEKDSLGTVEVPADKYWGAQTQRSFQNFKIGTEKMPDEIIKAFAVIKKAAAIANAELGVLSPEKRDLITAVSDEISSGKLDGEFPLVVWQTGSGTQTNMNVNEVIANRGNEIAGKKVLHPNDDVNKSQSSNDTFPTALHVASVFALDNLLASVKPLIASFKRLEEENKNVLKSGRTHLQDAVPLTFGQEVSAWRVMLEKNVEQITLSQKGLFELALGGTAVGTGLNAPKGFSERVAEIIGRLTSRPFVTEENKFHALTSKDALVFAHGALKALASNLFKIANDVRWLASGPRLGLGEITIPANEPGSSIMPGKVNPTQCEALTMVCVQVFGNDQAVAFAAASGNFQLNVFMPVIAYNFLQSARLLSDAMTSFDNNLVKGIKVNADKMKANVDNNLMLATALNPYLGYDKVAVLVKVAYAKNLSLKDACVSLGYLTESEFDKIFDSVKNL